MKLYRCSLLAAVLLLLVLAGGVGAATDFDFFFHVQQWRGSYCDTQAGCCFPGNKKPAADFGIHGMWPNYAACRNADGAGRPLNGSRCWPDFCNATEPLDGALIRDLEGELLRNWGSWSCRNKNATAFWSHEWRKHGTCSNMGQHAYFRAALRFKARFNLTRILKDAGIQPLNERTYHLSSIRDAVAEATGSAPLLQCNLNDRNETQLYQVYQCVGVDGRSPVRCPRQMDGRCTDKVKFPAF